MDCFWFPVDPFSLVKYTKYSVGPYQLCPHVVVVVGLVCFDDPWGYAVEPLMPDRSYVRFWTERETEGLHRARMIEVRFRDGASAHQTCLCKRTRYGETPEEESTSLKKTKLECATRDGPDTGPTVCRCRENRSNEVPWIWHQGQLTERPGFLVSRSLTLCSAHV